MHTSITFIAFLCYALYPPVVASTSYILIQVGQCTLPVPRTQPNLSHSSVTLQDGTVVNHDAIQRADVLIKDGLIEAVAPELKVWALVVCSR